MQRMGAMNSAAEEIRVNYLPSLVLINDLTNSVQRLRIKENRYILSTEPAERRAGEKEMTDLFDREIDYNRDAALKIADGQPQRLRPRHQTGANPRTRRHHRA